MATPKANVLLVRGGAVGSIAAVNIEVGGLGAVTLVARSNYTHINELGYDIEFVDHGKLQGWRPTTSAFIRLKYLHSGIEGSQILIFLISSYKLCP
jgi:ketopantoate reductase